MEGGTFSCLWRIPRGKVLARISHQFACRHRIVVCCQYVMIICSLYRHNRLRLMRPRLSFLRQWARAPSTIATAMLSVAGAHWRHKSARSRFGHPKDALCAMEGAHQKSGAIIASTGEKYGLEFDPILIISRFPVRITLR